MFEPRRRRNVLRFTRWVPADLLLTMLCSVLALLHFAVHAVVFRSVFRLQAADTSALSWLAKCCCPAIPAIHTAALCLVGLRRCRITAVAAAGATCSKRRFGQWGTGLSCGQRRHTAATLDGVWA